MVNEDFCSDKKIGAIFYPFLVQNLAIFTKKIRFLNIFFETTHQICLKLGQNVGTIALDHRMAVLCLGKFLLWSFWPFLGPKYIACGVIYIYFLAFFGHFLPERWCFRYFLLFELCLWFRNEKWKALTKNLGHLGQLIGANS